MDELSIAVYQPLWMGGAFIDNVTPLANSLSYNVRRVGGYWEATYTQAVSRQEIDD